MKPARIVVFLVVFALLGLLAYAFGSNGSLFNRSSLRVGGPAPDFSVQLFSGDTFKLADQRGKVVVVNFWASWCQPCREEAAMLQRAWQAYQDRGVVLVGINEQDSEQGARGFIKEFGITFLNGPDPNAKIANAYGLTGYPETSFIDRNGRLVRRWIGPLTERQINSFIEEALQSAPVPSR